jgi:hypothetical protein
MHTIKATRKKPLVIEYVKFETNNETGSPHMDELVNWVNKGKPSPATSPFVLSAWHNGTDIFLQSTSRCETVRVGDYIVKNEYGDFNCRDQQWIDKWNNETGNE